MYTSTTIQLSSFWNMSLVCINLTPLSLINPQLTLTHFSPPLNTKIIFQSKLNWRSGQSLQSTRRNWLVFCTRLPKYHDQNSNNQHQIYRRWHKQGWSHLWTNIFHLRRGDCPEKTTTCTKRSTRNTTQPATRPLQNWTARLIFYIFEWTCLPCHYVI